MKYNALEARLEENDLLPIAECKLENYSASINATLLSHAKIYDKGGLITGYVKIEDTDQIIELLKYPCKHGSHGSWFKNIDDLPHVYVDKSKSSGISLIIKPFNISPFIFYQVDLTKFRASNTVFAFIARVSIKDLDKIKEVVNGKENLRKTKRSMRRLTGPINSK